MPDEIKKIKAHKTMPACPMSIPDIIILIDNFIFVLPFTARPFYSVDSWITCKCISSNWNK